MKKILGVFIFGFISIGCGNERFSTEVALSDIDGLQLVGLGREAESVKMLNARLTITENSLTLSSLDSKQQYRFDIPPDQIEEIVIEDSLGGESLNASRAKSFVLNSRSSGQPVDLTVRTDVELKGKKQQFKIEDCDVHDVMFGHDYPVKIPGERKVIEEVRTLAISLNGVFVNSNGYIGNFKSKKPQEITDTQVISKSNCVRVERPILASNM